MLAKVTTPDGQEFMHNSTPAYTHAVVIELTDDAANIVIAMADILAITGRSCKILRERCDVLCWAQSQQEADSTAAHLRELARAAAPGVQIHVMAAIQL